MSYLGPLRLHFSGTFQADPSTVNNDPTNFDNNKPARNGSWNPNGGASFRLIRCSVTRAGYGDGTTSTTDPVVGLSVADTPSRVAAKLVDLDPEQQLVSQIWGLVVRLTDGTTDFVSGRFTVAPFADIWFGRGQAGGDGGAGSFYQSTIEGVAWGGDRGSRFLEELRAASPDELSIKFNVDSYNTDSTSAGFTMGRITGTIGPAVAGEPRHFLLGRQLFPYLNRGTPVTMNFAQAIVDRATRRIYLDLGNSLPTGPNGMNDIGTLTLGHLDASNQFHAFAPIDYLGSGWYTTTAGVAVLPDRDLTDAELQTLETHRLAIKGAGNAPIVQENFDGLYTRADDFVFRLNPRERAEVKLYATQYGKRLPNATIVAFRDTSGLQGGRGTLEVGVPKDRVTFPSRLTTGADGTATLTIEAGDPGNPRVYIDGQIYGVRYLLEKIRKRVPAVNQTFGVNPSDFVSLLVWDAYEVPDAPVWWNDLQPIFQQYANLYPLMDTLLNLADYEAVAAKAQLLAFAFGLPLDDPNSMPVTRDLSAPKRQAILKWLTTPGADGKPLLGTAPAALAAADLAPAAPAQRDPDAESNAKRLATRRRGELVIPEEI